MTVLENGATASHPCRSASIADPAGNDPSSATAADLLATARWFRRLAGRREEVLGSNLFFDPAWRMLIELYICRVEGRTLSVSAVGMGVGAASATALRYLGLMEDAGLVVRRADPRDGRRTFVHLTQPAWAALTKLMDPRT